VACAENGACQVEAGQLASNAAEVMTITVAGAGSDRQRLPLRGNALDNSVNAAEVND
jgi:hypothetical protein